MRFVWRRLRKETLKEVPPKSLEMLGKVGRATSIDGQ